MSAKIQNKNNITTQEEFEDTKGKIRIHISKKNRQHNGQKKNSWSQGRPSSSPVQSIVTCECHNHVVSV